MKNFKKKINTLLYLALFSQSLLLIQCTSKEAGEVERAASDKAETGKRVLIEVNGEPIHLYELEEKLDRLKKRFSPLTSDSKKLDSGILLNTAANNLIQERLIRQEASKRKIFITESEVDSVVKSQIDGYSPELFMELLREGGTTEREWRRGISHRLLLKKFSNLVIGKSLTVTDEEIQEYYKSNLDQFVFPMKVRALHILVLSREKADELQKALKEGADFGELAIANSIAPEARSGGDLGFFSVGQMPIEFDQVVFNLKVGEVSDVISTTYGFHLFTLMEKRTPVKKRSNFAVRIIRKRLMDKKRDQAYKNWVNMVLGEAEIKYTDNWKNYTLEEK